MDRLSHNDMVHGLDSLAQSKADWLSTFSDGKKKRPDHEIETQRQHLAVLRQAADDYRKAVERAA